MIKLRSMRTLTRTISKLGSRRSLHTPAADPQKPAAAEIKWELRPGGMLVQKREIAAGEKPPAMIAIKVTSTVASQWHDISIGATATFGELKMVLSLLTGLKPREQRLLYRGKERGDDEHLHMVGVREGDKVLLLEDPAIKEAKLRRFVMEGSSLMAACRSIRV